MFWLSGYLSSLFILTHSKGGKVSYPTLYKNLHRLDLGFAEGTLILRADFCSNLQIWRLLRLQDKQHTPDDIYTTELKNKSLQSCKASSASDGMADDTLTMTNQGDMRGTRGATLLHD